MRLSELLRESLITLDFQAPDKWDAITQLVDMLVAQGEISPEHRQDVLDVVFERERSVTTGMERGIAIPHANSTVVQDVVGTFAIAPQGVPFESLDGKPAHLIILLVIPKDKFLQHVRTLAGIARLLNHQDAVSEFLQCREPTEVMERILAEEEREE